MKITEFLKKILQKLLFNWKLRRMDGWWHFWGGSTYELFPPSYYYKYSKEELDKMKQKEIDELEQMLAEYEEKYCNIPRQ